MRLPRSIPSTFAPHSSQEAPSFQRHLFARKSKRFADQFNGGPEAGLRQKVLDDRRYGWQESIALCANKNAQDSDRGETKSDINEAAVRLVDENTIRDNNHTPRMRSMAARSLCRSLTE